MFKKSTEKIKKQQLRIYFQYIISFNIFYPIDGISEDEMYYTK